MSYASVAAHNAPPPSQQPHPDPNLLTTQDDVSGGSLPDLSNSVNVAPSDFKSNPHVSISSYIRRKPSDESFQTVTSETVPATYDSSDDEGQGNRTGSSKRRAAKDRARKSLHKAEEEGLYLWAQFKERVLRPGTAGGILGVGKSYSTWCCYLDLTFLIVNVGLLAFAGREFYTKPHLRHDGRAIGIIAATAIGLLGAEGALADAYVKTDAGKKEKERAKKEGAALYRQAREVVLRPGVLGGLVGVLNLGILGGVGYAAYLNWDQPRWDRRTVSAVSVGLLTLAAGEG